MNTKWGVCAFLIVCLLLSACGSAPASQPQIRTIIATPTPLARPIIDATPSMDREGWKVNLTVHNVEYEEYQIIWYPLQQGKWASYGPAIDVRLTIIWKNHPEWKYDNHWLLRQTTKNTD